MDKKVWKVSRAIKSMVYEGLNYGDLGFCLGKTKLVRDAGLPYTFGGDAEKSLRGRINYLLACILYLLPHNFISKFVELPSFMFPTWYKIIDGHKFTIREGEKSSVVRGILADYKLVDSWEPNTQRVIREKVKVGDVCVDIGASMGDITMALAREVGPTGKVIAIEPTERCFNYLCMNIKANGYENIFPYKIAAYDKNELVEMPKNDFNPIYCNGWNMSDFLDKIGEKKIDFIKIDVDGPEPLVLRGLIPVFEANPQLKMIVEWYQKYIEGADCSPDEFWEIINKYFTWTKIEGDYCEEYYNIYAERKLAM